MIQREAGGSSSGTEQSSSSLTANKLKPEDDDDNSFSSGSIEEDILNDVKEGEEEEEDESESEEDEEDDEEYDDFSVESYDANSFAESFYESDGDGTSYYSNGSSIPFDEQTFGTTGSSHGQSTEFDSESTKAGKKDEKKPIRWGCFGTIFLLLAIGTSLAVTLAALSTNYEQEDVLEQDYHDFCEELMSAWQSQVKHVFTTLDSMAVDVSMATNAMSTSNWPKVTLSEFAVWGTNTEYLTDHAIVSTSLVPLVLDSERSLYEEYVKDNQEWISEAQAWEEMNQQRRLQNSVTANRIYTVDSEGNYVAQAGTGPFGPIRQLTPFQDDGINYDLLSNSATRAGIDGAFQNGTAALGPIFTQDGEDCVHLNFSS